MCSELSEVDVWRHDEQSDCYVTYPQTVYPQVNRTWYEARNKCLLLKGDLAVMNVTRAANMLNVLQPGKKYWIGLQRNPLMMPLTGTFYTQEY